MRTLKVFQSFIKSVTATFSKKENKQLIPIIQKDYCDKHFISDLYCDKNNIFI